MNSSLSASAMPVAVRTPLNTPPAPVINMIIPAGPSALVEISTRSSFEVPRLVPRNQIAKRVHAIRAIIGCPMKRMNCFQISNSLSNLATSTFLSALVNPDAISEVAISFTIVCDKIRTIGKAIRPQMILKEGKSLVDSFSLL